MFFFYFTNFALFLDESDPDVLTTTLRELLGINIFMSFIITERVRGKLPEDPGIVTCSIDYITRGAPDLDPDTDPAGSDVGSGKYER